MNTFVIGVDPGRSTGVAVLRDAKRFRVIQDTPHVALVALGNLLATYSSRIDRLVVACERYYVGPTAGARSPQSVVHEVIGSLRLLLDSYDCVLLTQSPADAKKIAPNSLLRELGLYVTKQDVDRPDANDANDAMRHALLALARACPGDFDRLLRSRGGEPIE